MRKNMANRSTFCVICQSKKKPLYLFTERTLNRSTEMLKIRKIKRFKYNDVELPSTIDKLHGFHKKCYSNFIAVQAKYRQVTKESDFKESRPSTSSSQSPLSAFSESIHKLEVTTTVVAESAPESKTVNTTQMTSVGVCEAMLEDAAEEKYPDEPIKENKILCIFCGNHEKHFKGFLQNLHITNNKNVINNIKSMATQLNDYELLQRCSIFSPGSTKIIAYHSICKLSYNNKIQKIVEKERTIWHKDGDHHKVAFDQVCSFISTNIIGEKQFCFLSFLDFLYTNSLREECENDSSVSSPSSCSPNHLEMNIFNTFDNKIEIVIMNNKKIVKAKDDIILQDTDFEILERNDIIDRSALILRLGILKMKKSELSGNSVNDYIVEECKIPDVLNRFYVALLSGWNHEQSLICQSVLTTPFCNDAIFAVTNETICSKFESTDDNPE